MGAKKLGYGSDKMERNGLENHATEREKVRLCFGQIERNELEMWKSRDWSGKKLDRESDKKSKGIIRNVKVTSILYIEVTDLNDL